jgi:iron(III) transport system permease protein
MKVFRSEPLTISVIILIWVLLGLFIIYPLATVIVQSLSPHGSFSFEVYERIIKKVYFRKPFVNSLKLGVTVAFLGTAIGYIFAYVINRTDVPLKRFFRTTATMPIISPPFAMALALILLFGRNGIITKGLLKGTFGEFPIYGFWGLVVVETLAYFPTAFLTLDGILKSIDPSLEEASMNLGAGKWRVFWTVTLPLSTPGILSAWLLVFSQSMADFGNPMIIGGNFPVLSTAAYLQITGMYDTPGGAGLAVLLLIPTLIAFVVQKYWLSRKSYVTVTGKPSSMRMMETEKIAKSLFTLLLSALSATIFLFYGTVFYGSFTKLWGVNYSLTLENYAFVFDVGLDYIKDTLLLASIAAPIAGFLGIIISYITSRRKFVSRRMMEATSLLTFAVPGTVVGIGYLLAFNNPPLVLTGTAIIIILVFVFRYLPVGVQSGTAALYQIDQSIDEASYDLGAGTWRTFFKVAFPLITPAFFSGLFYSFVKSITAISAVIFVVSGRWNLVTIAILGSVENSDLSQAAAYSTVLILIVLTAMALMRWVISLFSYERAIEKAGG